MLVECYQLHFTTITSHVLIELYRFGSIEMFSVAFLYLLRNRIKMLF